MSPQKTNNMPLKVTSAVVVTIAVVMLLIVSTVSKAQQSGHSGIVSMPVTNSSTASSTTTPSTSTTSSTTTPQSSSSNSTSTSTSSGYKDGTYSAVSDYYVPHGYEAIQVSLTLKNGIITDSSVQNSESNGESAYYQRAFASSYKSYVTGKSISGLNLSYIAGASDTTNGFNDAVSQIQNQAKA